MLPNAVETFISALEIARPITLPYLLGLVGFVGPSVISAIDHSGPVSQEVPPYTTADLGWPASATLGSCNGIPPKPSATADHQRATRSI